MENYNTENQSQQEKEQPTKRKRRKKEKYVAADLVFGNFYFKDLELNLINEIILKLKTETDVSKSLMYLLQYKYEVIEGNENSLEIKNISVKAKYASE